MSPPRASPSLRNPYAGARLRRAALGLIFCVYAPGLSGQALNLRQYRNQDGLAQVQVLSLVQDTLGYLLIGSYGGLTRFDGSEFTTLTREDGLPSNTVQSLARDARGRIIVGTGGGACLMEDGGFRCVGDGRDGGPPLSVHHAFADSDGRTWLSTAGGITVVDAAWTQVLATYTAANGLPTDWVWQVRRDDSGTMWAATAGGLARLAGATFEARHSTEIPVARVLISTLAGLIAGGDRDLWRVNDTSATALGAPPATMEYVAATEDRRGTVWLAGRAGLVEWDGSRFRLFDERNGLAQNALLALVVDREDNLWLGSDQGLTRLTHGAIAAFTANEGLPGPFVRAIHEDADGRLWVGTREGLAVWNGESFRTVTRPGDLPDDRIYSIGHEADGPLLVGTRGGLVAWDGSVRQTFRTQDGLPDDYVRSVLADPSGGAWVATRSGAITRYEQGRIVPFAEGHPLHSVVADAMIYDAEGRLWMALPAGGVAIWDGEVVTELGPTDGLSEDPIWSFAVDLEGGVWMGTNGGGSVRWANESATRVRMTDGLANDFVWQLVAARDGAMWMYTNQGLDRYQDGEFRHFGIGDGLLELEGSANSGLQTADGTLWFGSGNGLMRYTLEDDVLNDVPPPIVIDRVDAEGMGLLKPGVVLPHRVPLLTLNYEALSFTRPEDVRYRYRLVLNGNIPEWSAPTPASEVRFAEMGSGDYEFQVMGYNNDGVPSLEPAVFAFSVSPAPWETWWFRLFALLALLALGRVILSWRTRRLIAERYRLEEEVAAQTEELRAKNVDLEHARDAAEAAKTAKSTFLASMSHEIRTPMNGVLGMAQILLGTEQTEEQREHTQTILSSGGALMAILNDILDFSKIEAGKLEVEPIPFDLMVSCSDVASLLSPKAEEKGIEIVLRYAPETPRHLVGDPGRIRQILTNLAGNAIKFTAEGHVLIEVEALGQDEGAAQIRVAVHDSGIGMDKEAMKHLFQPFHQADASTTRRFGGTGLGLAISRQLVEIMDGEIGVESTPGEGSTFWFVLTLPHAASKPLPWSGDGTILEGARVLVVDDIEANRRILSEALQGWRAHPVAASGGDEALGALRSAVDSGEPFPLAVLDYQMPGMDGVDLAHQIKADPDLSATVLVLFTSSSERGDDRITQEAGFAGYLVKPAQMDIVRDVLVTLLTDLKEGRVRNELVTRYSVAEAKAASALAAAKPPPSPAADLIGLRVLVAEDNKVNQLVVGKMLEKLGCVVFIAENGAEAAELYQTASYDVVLMDCQMPVMDGFEATAKIRELEAEAGGRHTPIIAATANAMKGDRERCIEVGMDDYLDKPIKMDALVVVISRWASASQL